MTDKPHLGADVSKPGSVRVWRCDFNSADDRLILRLWRLRNDTLRIAELMHRHEHEVANRLAHIRGANIGTLQP